MYQMFNKTIKCDLCERSFVNKQNYNRHRRDIHQLKANATACNVLCPTCNNKFLSNSEYLSHLENGHEVMIESNTMTFANESGMYTAALLSILFIFAVFLDFSDWKIRIETATKAQYIKYSSDKISNGSIKSVYQCNRSGFYESKSAGIREKKIAGPRKISGTCPARIKKTVCKSDGSIIASWISTHYGHSMELKHLNLPKNDQSDIVQMLLSKIPESILGRRKASSR